LISAADSDGRVPEARPRSMVIVSWGDRTMDDNLRKRMLAVNVLLEIPEAIPDGLEAELYAYRDRLQAEALSS
jgi:hypothetical protein